MQITQANSNTLALFIPIEGPVKMYNDSKSSAVQRIKKKKKKNLA